MFFGFPNFGRSFSSFGQRCLLIPRLPFETAFGQGCSGKLWSGSQPFWKARPEALRARSRSWHTWVDRIAWKKYRTPVPGAWEAFSLLTRLRFRGLLLKISVEDVAIFGQAIGDPAGQQIWECFAAYLALRLWRSRHTLSVSKHVLCSSYLECGLWGLPHHSCHTLRASHHECVQVCVNLQFG
jgi:hypothetical protein